MRFLLVLVALGFASRLTPPRLTAAEPLTVPPGFVVAEYAGPAVANDITALHIDADGRVVVAGRGYARYLPDDDRDGQTDRGVELVAGLTNAPMGVLWEKETLHLVADGGLRRYRGVTEKAPVRTGELLLALKATGEHDAHAVRRGPDGALYLLCGNTAGVTRRTVTGAASPVKEPTAGCLLRVTNDGKVVEVIADGFRNPYDFDFDLAGEPFTFDSDNERCVGLPWYEPTRFYRVVPGGHYGWLNPQGAQAWRRPPYFPDVVAPVATLGRGSPTGVACYRHTHFPEPYRGGFFLADWTFGKVWFVPPGGKPVPFLEATGESGFAPTGLAVHPKTGELFVSTGGRGTRGAVYKVSWRADGRQAAGADTRPLPFAPGKPREPLRREPPGEPRAEAIAQANTPAAKLAVVRSWQVALGDITSRHTVGTVWEGYTLGRVVDRQLARQLAAPLRAAFPSGDADLDRELTRTLAALGDDDDALLGRVVARLTAASDPVDDVHHLIVLGRLGGARDADTTRAIAAAVLGLDRKFEQRKLARDRNWPLRLSETATNLLAEDATLAGVLVAHPDFARPGNAWVAKLGGLDRPRAARRFLAAAAQDKDFAWTPGLVELLAALPDAEVRPHLAGLWDRGGLDDALVPILARSPVAADRPRLVRGLRAVNPTTVRLAATALAKLPTADDEVLPAVQALRQLGPAARETQATAAALVALLRARTGLPHESAKDWEAWLTKERPALAKQLAATGYDAAAWSKRLAGVKWDAGDAANGRRVYVTATCAACHDGGQAVGPSLQGVAKRFGRDDLLTAILDPSRDVPARYRPVRVTTDDGKVHDGLVIYEAVDGVILQTGADATVRVAGGRIESRRALATSLMPGGLLDRLTDAEVADLMAYLRSDPPK